MPTKQKATISKLLWKFFIVCILLVILLQVFINYNHSIEAWYSTSFYPVISNLLRILFGWLPFSVGDLFYVAIIVFFVVRIVRFFRKLRKKQLSWQKTWKNLIAFLVFILGIYIVFYSFWGLNYYRKGIAFQLGIERKEYSTEELESLTKTLAVKANQYRHNIADVKDFHLERKQLFGLAKQSYDSVGNVYSFLKFKHTSTKASLFGSVGNYLGYTGYYNPFSGEAQVNMHSPDIVLPAVVCHEMAHQLGYATEDEANFVGYLAASHSPNKIFLYSTYLDLYQYAAGELFVRDSSKYSVVRQSLDTLVRKDIQDIRKFYLPYRTRMRKIINVIYGQYLKANNQPQGIDTYSDVISLLMAYQRKYGKI